MEIHSYAAFGISAGIWTLSGTRPDNSIEVTDLPNVVRSSSTGYEVIASRVFLRIREIVPYFPTVSSSSIACGERLGGRGAAPGRRGLVVGLLLSVETSTVPFTGQTYVPHVTGLTPAGFSGRYGQSVKPWQAQAFHIYAIASPVTYRSG